MIPKAWRSQHVLLNFGAVSWVTKVWINGRLVGTHRGDYTAFSFDITRELRAHGANELVVGYVNPVGGAGEPVGKQSTSPPSGILHSANSGIWQTVWLEPVARQHIASLALTPDVAHRRLLIAPTLSGGGRLQLQAQALAGGHVVSSEVFRTGHSMALRIPHPRLWWPSSPYLYGLRLRLMSGGRVLDQVSSYFGMRSVTLGRIGGVTRILINGRFLFQTGALDQGYWPDGLYAAPADAALRFDVQSAKRLGFNMIRQHAKVESDRWYMWADRLGLLVWQDIPNMPLTTPHPPTPAAQAEFRREMADIVAQRRSHPSVVTWIPFNEGWQQFDLTGITQELKRLDPGALVDTQSGSANCCDALQSSASNIVDSHLYTGPFALAPDRRASAVGEYGGFLPLSPPGHRYPGAAFSVGNPALGASLFSVAGALQQQYAMLSEEMRTGGLSASIFTELGAYEQELGLISYDRDAYTVPPNLVAGLNGSLVGASLNLTRLPAVGAGIPGGSTGYWSFDEGGGSTAADSSGNGHALTLSPGATFTSGRHGAGLALPGRGAVAATTASAVINTTQSFTVSAWLRSDAVGQSGTAVSQPGANGSAFSLGIETAGRDPQTREGEASSGVAPPLLRTWWTFAAPARPSCPALSCGVQANMHYDDGRLSPQPGSWHYVTGVYNAATHDPGGVRRWPAGGR